MGRTVVGQFGRVNVLVNNAGVSLTGDLTDLDVADMEWVVGINFWGVVHGTRDFLPHLIASGDGHVVTISSLFGLMAVPGQTLYNATKFAVRGFSESLREEMLVAGHPVGVTVVHPGGIKTAIVRNSRVSAREDHAETPGSSTNGSPRCRPSERPRSSCAACCAGSRECWSASTRTLLHQFQRVAGARYQDVVARGAAAAMR